MNRLAALAQYGLLMALGAASVAPLVWMVAVSLHPPLSPLPAPTQLFAPPRWAPENYVYVLTLPELPVWRFALNSLITSLGVVALQLLLCVPAAYAFARLRFPGRDALFGAFLVTMMVPPQVLIVPLYLITQRLGWLDTYAGLIVPYPYLHTAFGTFLLRQYFLSIPRTLDDAARLDGCGELRTLWHILLPLSRPATGTVAVFALVWSWTEFYWPLLAASSNRMRTLETGLAVFKDAYGGTNWPLQMAAAVVVLAPLLLFFLAMQRYFVRSDALGGLKG